MNNFLKNIDKENSVLIAINATLISLLLVFGLMIFKTKNGTISENNPSTQNSIFIADKTIVAKNVFIFDVKENRVIYAKNENETVPLASLSKIMTALTARKILPNDTKIVIKENHLSQEGDSGLKNGEEWKLKDLIDFSLVVSSNDGAFAIANTVNNSIKNSANSIDAGKDFVDIMNTNAQKLNLKSLIFTNTTGLDSNAEYGGEGSAKDISLLMKYTLEKYPEILEATKEGRITKSSKQLKHSAINTNKIIDKIPGLLASKTGYTDSAGGNLSIIFDAGLDHVIIITVLGSTEQDRFSDMENLVSSTFTYLNSN